MKAKAKSQVETIVKTLAGIEDDRQLSKEVVEDALSEALKKAFIKNSGIADVNVRVDIKDGNIHIYQVRTVVDEVEDDELEVDLLEARKKNPFVQLGDTVDEEVDFKNFDRAAVVLAKNVMKQKIREAEKQQVYEEYCDKVDEMVFGTVETVEDKFMLVKLDKTIAMMKKADQIPTEDYREGDSIQVVIKEVNKETKGAQVLVSRATPTFVRRLFEREVPEIYKGIIEIKAIARDPGERCKIAVESHNVNIDPIGACIGPKGSRVQEIINELHGEKIDIFQWSDNIQDLIRNALSPSEALAVIPNPDVKDGLIVVVPDNQLSLAIGKRGKNARLAVKLSGKKIDIKAQSEMDEKGIDYMSIAKEMQQEYEEKKAAELAYKQKLKADELTSTAGPIEDINVDDFELEEPELELPESIPSSADEFNDADLPAITEDDLPAVVEDEPKELSEIEQAARIAKEMRKDKHITDVKSYTSKFESIAGTAKKEAEPAAKAKKKDDKAEDKMPSAKKKPSFEAMKPIYSDEELAEIEDQENDAYDSWDDDVDYEEYDSYYDNK